MIRKATFTLITLFSLFAISYAQYTPKLNGKASMKFFLPTTTVVILTGEEEFDIAFKEAVTANWTITKHRFVERESVNTSLLQDDTLSFISIEDFKVKEDNKTYSALGLFMGGVSNTNVYITNTLAYVSIDKQGTERKLSQLNYRIDNMVHQLQNVISLTVDSNISANSEEEMNHALEDIYAEQAPKLENKTLLVDIAYTVSKITAIEQFKKNYGYEVKVVTKSEMANAIKDKTTGAAYLLSTYNNVDKINTVTDCATGDIIFSELETSNETFSTSLKYFDDVDLERLKSAIQPKEKKKKK